MGSSSGGTTKTTTTQKMSPQSKELLNLVMPTIKGYVNPDGSVNASTYPGQTVAPTNANQTLGQEMVLGQSGAAGASANAANTGMNFLTSGQVLDPKSNPYLTDAINAAIRPITENYTQTVLGSIRDNAQLAGAYGYNRQGLEDAAAGSNYMKQVGDTASTMSSANYQAGLDAMSRSMAFAPGVQQMLYTPGAAVAGVGQQQQQQSQAQIDAAVQKFYQQQYLPLSLAEEIAGIAYGNPSGSVTSTGQGGGTSGLQSALGLGAAGASLGSMIMPGVGTAAGGALGALLGLFG
jgi:hypothetical protein